MRWTVAWKIGSAFGVFTVLLLSVSAVSYVQTQEAEQELKTLKEEELESGLLSQFTYHLSRLERALHRRVLAETGADDDAIENLAAARKVLSTLRQFTSQTTEAEQEHEERETRLLDGMQAALEQIDAALNNAAWLDVQARDKHRPLADGVLAECEQLSEAVRRFRSEDYLVAQEARERSKGVTRQSTNIVFYTALASVLATVVAGIYFVSKISGPIKKLSEGARQIGDGDFAQDIQVGTSDEISDLAREFNHMSARLKDSYKNMEQQVSDKTRQLLHSARLAGIGTLATGIAHEINNPLASVSSCAEGLLARAADPALQNVEAFRDFNEYLAIIRDETYRCSAITRNLLDFSRKPEPVIEQVNLVERIEGVIALLRRNAEAEAKTVDLVSQATDSVVDADPNQLSQLFFNLIGNGLEAVAQGGRVQILVEAPDPDRIRVSVTDNGIGIAPDAIERIWEPFYTTKPPGEGTGLGLSLCYSIVQNHHGQIVCVSDGPDRGAAFARTPARKDHSPADRSIGDRPAIFPSPRKHFRINLPRLPRNGPRCLVRCSERLNQR